MNEDSKSKLKDILSTIDPVEYKWDSTNTTVGVIAQEIGEVDSEGTITLTGSQDYISIGSIGAAGSTITFDSNAVNWNSNYTIGAGLHADNTEYGSNQIKLGNGKTIDLDELHDVMETLKKRLLILTPNFEQMKKYPMLKELYDEYKAMERLLDGPDNTPEDM
ncbi:hypothetical protein UFOVP71_407 [uncultured Caudovirales phage]|uniref:Uncharacterized protein n=1 Tax=uncultured Caudovirales phage TaxID=2100421 RepID=A0A6J5TC39_9CAUD|nr:hypothetical protein UFOVP71_407 [uncultured Caudovirales phage]